MARQNTPEALRALRPRAQSGLALRPMRGGRREVRAQPDRRLRAHQDEGRRRWDGGDDGRKQLMVDRMEPEVTPAFGEGRKGVLNPCYRRSE